MKQLYLIIILSLLPLFLPAQNSKTFNFGTANMQGKNCKCTLNEGTLDSSPFYPIVIVTIFTQECGRCKAMFPYLNDLKRKYAKELLVLALPVNSMNFGTHGYDNKKMFPKSIYFGGPLSGEKFLSGLKKVIHNDRKLSLPLTIIFKNGKFIQYIQGAVPEEMLLRIIKNLKEKD